MKNLSIYPFVIFLLLFITCDAKIVFVHIPKTAGTTLHTLIRSNFAKSQCYPKRVFIASNNFDFSQKNANNFFKRFPIITHEYITGHFPMWFFQEMDPDYDRSYFITVLRDPVDRVMSHFAQLKDHPNKKVKVHSDIRPNMMCKMLCSDLSLKGEALLKNSIENLHRMDFIIFQDDFENGVRQLFSELHLKLPKNGIPVKNRSNREAVSKDVIQEIKIMNALDIQLYDYAKKYLR